jgi:nitronate monooxygenase
MGQFCIDQQLGHALAGDVQKGLYFRGAGVLPFGDNIRSVKELLTWLISGHDPMHIDHHA